MRLELEVKANFNIMLCPSIDTKIYFVSKTH